MPSLHVQVSHFAIVDKIIYSILKKDKERCHTHVNLIKM